MGYKEVNCNSCRGRGRRTCASCGGTGFIQRLKQRVPCSVCGGMREIKCTTCSGTGKTKVLIPDKR